MPSNLTTTPPSICKYQESLRSLYRALMNGDNTNEAIDALERHIEICTQCRAAECPGLCAILLSECRSETDRKMGGNQLTREPAFPCA